MRIDVEEDFVSQCRLSSFPAEIIAAQKDLAYTENQLADLENEWLEASAALEKLN